MFFKVKSHKTHKTIKANDFLNVLFIIVFISLIAFASCDFFSKKSKCEKIIDKDKMVEVMTDIYLLESYIQINTRNRPRIQDSVEYFYSGLFKNHSIRKETFDKALECYSLNRELIARLNEEVLNKLSIMESMEAIDDSIPTNFIHN